MTDSQIEQDISNWNRDRLHQWLDDSMARFEMGDVDIMKAESHVLSVLMVTIARMLVRIKVPPDEAGAKFAEVVRYAHGQEMRRRGSQRCSE